MTDGSPTGEPTREHQLEQVKAYAEEHGCSLGDAYEGLNPPHIVLPVRGGAKRPARFLGVDEARVEFIEAIPLQLPEVSDALAGEAFAAYAEGDPALGPILTAWQRRWNLWRRPVLVKNKIAKRGRWTSTYQISTWCREKALEVLDDRAAGSVPPGTVDLVRDVSPLPVPLASPMERYPDESPAEAFEKNAKALREAIASQGDVIELRNPAVIGWAVLRQCGAGQGRRLAWAALAERLALTTASGGDPANLRRDVGAFLAFIGLE